MIDVVLALSVFVGVLAAVVVEVGLPALVRFRPVKTIVPLITTTEWDLVRNEVDRLREEVWRDILSKRDGDV